jgi:hypothetical protein
MDIRRQASPILASVCVLQARLPEPKCNDLNRCQDISGWEPREEKSLCQFGIWNFKSF